MSKDKYPSIFLPQMEIIVFSGLFKDYDLHMVTALSADIAGMDALSLNYGMKFKKQNQNVET